MSWGNGPWGFPFGSPMPDQLAQMRARNQSAPWQNRPLYAVMVDGEQAARNYFVPPGEKAIMFDKENPVFYIKEVNEYNAVSFEKYRYEAIHEEGNADSEYVTRAELNQILAQMAGNQQPMTEQKQPQQEQAAAPRRRRMEREAANDEQPGV